MKNLMRLLLVAPIVGFSLASCNKAGTSSDADLEKEPAIDMSALDTTIRPQDDFYLFANKGWMDANPLKEAYSRYGAFDILNDRSLERLHTIVDELQAKKQKKGTNEYRVAVLYNQAMDSTKRNELGATPIQPILKEVDAVQSKEDLVKLIAKHENEGSVLLIPTHVFTDPKNSDINIMHVGQMTLPLGNRDYYVKDTEENSKILKAYCEYIQKVAQLAGYTQEDAARIAANNLKISKEIATMCYSNEELRDSHLNYNMLEVSKFVESHKGFDWKTYLKLRGLDNLKEWDVSQLRYYDDFDKWFPKVDLRELKDFFLAGEIDSYATLLSDDFNQASFDFYGKVLSGKVEQHPRWRRAMNLVNGTMGEALGQIYVKKYFKPEAKEKMIELIANLQAALSDRINTLEWMSQETKQKAQEKLSSFKVKVGYPDKWEDYSKLDIDENKTLVETYLAVTRFEHDRNMADLGKPVDRDRWYMNPQEVNAYYMPTTNEICFPAGILQPPFFNVNADDAVNYGAIGVVIGHEMTHGFDDQGRNFDKDGNMNDWWTKEDAEKFRTAASKLVAQFNKIEIAPGLMANGQLTLGENIADQGGLLVAYLALQKALEGKKVEPIDGFTPAQRFFIGYARVWGQNIRPEERRNLTKVDVHSLGEYRVNQSLKNIDAFYEAFGIKEGDPMYIAPEDRVLVW